MRRLSKAAENSKGMSTDGNAHNAAWVLWGGFPKPLENKMARILQKHEYRWKRTQRSVGSVGRLSIAAEKQNGAYTPKA